MLYIDRLPEDLLKLLKATEQNLKYHPERTVYNHILLVEKEARKYNNKNLEIAAVFHDVGKPDALQIVKGEPVFYGHETISQSYINKYKNLYDDLDLDWDLIGWICLNHMKAHVLKDMRPFKREAFQNHKWFPVLLQFSECDNNGRLPMEED